MNRIKVLHSHVRKRQILRAADAQRAGSQRIPSYAVRKFNITRRISSLEKLVVYLIGETLAVGEEVLRTDFLAARPAKAALLFSADSAGRLMTFTLLSDKSVQFAN